MDRTKSGATTWGQRGPGSDGNERGTPHSPNLQHYRNLTLRVFSVIHWTFIDGGTSLQRCSSYVIPPQPTGQWPIQGTV